MRTASLARSVAVAAGVLLLLAAAPSAYANSAPVVSNVVATQIAGTGQVLITYDVSDADGDPVTVRVVCSSNNGATFDLLPMTLTGDVNATMAPGPGKRIIWIAAADFPGRYFTQVVAKVLASDGPALSGEMVSVPAGSFTMGSTAAANEQPVHTVYLDSFFVDKYEVTNAEFKQFIDAGGYSTPAFWSGAGWSARSSYGWTQPLYWTTGEYHSGTAWPGFPVVGVSWYEAEAYANFVGKRLPTEAEWEKAARGTDQRTYPWGEGLDGSRANYYGSGDPYDNNTTPVGFYDGRLHPNPPFQTTDSPSPYGAYDMAGNVWEWVADWYQSNYYSVSPPSNPPGPVSGSSRVLRGGAWDNDSGYLRSAYRRSYYYDSPYDRNYYIGFRCARTLP
jgi:sulfatase modifying factor 1